MIKLSGITGQEKRMIEKIRIGTRKSLLAQAQTRIVAEKIKEIVP